MFAFKQPAPWAHQLVGFNKFKDSPYFALTMPPRTGKSRVICDIAGYRWDKGDIRTLAIIAFPNGLHRNWHTDEVPAWMAVPHESLLWDNKSNTKRWQKEAVEKLRTKKLLVVCINVEAIITPRCKEFLKTVLKRGPVFTCFDESNSIAVPGSARTKVALRLAAYSYIRAIADGTPADEGPLRLYSQYGFLDKKILGFTSYVAFKHYYAEWEEGFNGATGTKYEALKRNGKGEPVYKNLDELRAKVAPFTYRVRKEDCFDLPPQVFQKRFFQMTKEQLAVYNELAEQFEADLVRMSGAGRVSAHHVLTRYMRLQQISSGFVPADAETAVCKGCDGEGCASCHELGVVGMEQVVRTFDRNPRLEAFLEEIDKCTGQNLIWARFDYDIDVIVAALKKRGRTVVQYDGRIPEKTRALYKVRFQKGDAQDLVGKTSAGGRGLDFAMAETMHYYSNVFSLVQRRQSEERQRGPKAVMHKQQDVIDYMAEYSVDFRIVGALRSKRKVADTIHGDAPGDWI